MLVNYWETCQRASEHLPSYSTLIGQLFGLLPRQQFNSHTIPKEFKKTFIVLVVEDKLVAFDTYSYFPILKSQFRLCGKDDLPSTDLNSPLHDWKTCEFIQRRPNNSFYRHQIRFLIRPLTNSPPPKKTIWRNLCILNVHCKSHLPQSTVNCDFLTAMATSLVLSVSHGEMGAHRQTKGWKFVMYNVRDFTIYYNLLYLVLA